mgnify:CR=1 FL=1|tara:strand:+ start:3592 stop:5925 length:2334 start_codon:yes stop_codon:yes gene_type:complete
MMNWQINKVEISSFKAFKEILLDLNNSSLLTLDGPNGFGKTSVFDAIELLLTGQIKRINNLFSKVMVQKQKNYEDNLFWNIRSGENDLTIKIEFYNQERCFTLARYASTDTLKDKSLNRADQFSQFTLYELPHFSSTDFSEENKRDNDYIEELFGKNFRENFCFLNYLEQGQNQLLLTRVDGRKDALEGLFNITDIASEISNCKAIERKFTAYLRDSTRKAKEQELTTECESLRSMAQADLGDIEFKKLSSIDPQPEWDKENLFPTYSSETLSQYLESIEKLKELSLLRNSIRVRDHNDKIESYITKNMASLKSLAQFGSDSKRLAALDDIKQKIDQLKLIKSILQRGASSITLKEAQTLFSSEPDKLKEFEELISKRSDLQQKSQSNAKVIAELSRLKTLMLKEHAKIYPDDAACPMCGADWKLHVAMLDAVEKRSKSISEELSSDGKLLLSLIDQMNSELKPMAEQVEHQEERFYRDYDSNLHTALLSEKVRLGTIIQLLERLQDTGTVIDYKFTDNMGIVDARLQEVIASIRAKKRTEKEALPENWRQVIESTFKNIDDFYAVEPTDFSNKILYVSAKSNETRNNKLQKSLLSLQQIQRENEAAQKVQEKVKALRTTLEKVERTYADHTISEIELIFHIYSGRLIQNYQRGLGLFIESRDGKQLRFLTAEKSDHDAVLSMSSGQVSALSLAFFLSLNKVYSRVPLILIDDPSQSLDEVNIASLTDLLRCELKERQLIVSSHEEDISSYMRYRFTKAGLTTRSLNMQSLAKEVAR